MQMSDAVGQRTNPVSGREIEPEHERISSPFEIYPTGI